MIRPALTILILTFSLILIIAAGMLTCLRLQATTFAWILYIDGRFSEEQIYRMWPDGSHAQQVANIPGRKIGLAVSEDSQWIAFTYTPDGNDEIYRIRFNGTGLTRLTNNPTFDGQPVWSSDDGWIAFYSDRDGDAEVYRMRPDGTQLQQITDNPAQEWQPAWSSDGHWLAFQSNRDGNYELYKVHLESGQLVRLTDNLNAIDAQPDWSPDGRWIAFSSGNIEAGFHIYRMDTNGQNIVRLTPNQPQPPQAENFFAPQWSPDGKWLTFWSNRNGEFVIYKMRPDGSDMQSLTQPSLALVPTWARLVNVPFRGVWPIGIGVVLIIIGAALRRQS